MNGLSELSDTINNLSATHTEIKRALRNSINSTATNARKFAINEISTKTALTKEFVEKKIRVKRTTEDNLTAEVLANSRRIPLKQYDPSITYQGTRGSVFADYSMLRDKELIGNRTFANPSSNRVFRRKGTKAYPIYSPTGPSITHHWTRIGDDAAQQANDELLKLFINRLRAQIRKRK